MENLLQLKLKDGTHIDVTRSDSGDVRFSAEDGHEVKLPKAPGHQVVELIALLEPFGEIVEGGESDD